MDRCRHSLSILGLMITCVFVNFARAQDFSFQNLSDEDFKKISRDLSADFMHTSVSGASTLGDLFGFEVGVVGGQTSTKEVDKYAKQGDPSASADTLPHGELIGMLSVPLALTVEMGLVPKVGNDSFKFSSYSLGAKWTPSELFFDWPVSLALKTQVTKVDATFKDTINSVNTTFDYKNTMFGATVLVSKNFAIFEPYAGFGWMRASSDMSVSGSSTVFTGARQSASVSPSSTLFLVGTEVKLLMVKLGVEYTKAFDTSRFTGKLSFFF